MQKNILIHHIKENILDKKNNFVKSWASDEIIDYLIAYTSFFVSNRYDYLNIRYYFLINNINNLKKCVHCSNYITNIKSIRDYNIKEYCSLTCVQQSKKVQEKIKQTNLDRYGTEYAIGSKKVQEKIKQTNLDRYGSEYAIGSKKVQEKIKQTNLDRYGVSTTLMLTDVQEKIKQTNIERYGNEYAIGSDQIQKKIKTTNSEKYGHEYQFMSKEIQEKIKKTFIEKYDETNPMKNSEIREKANKTNLEKYGTEQSSQIHLSEKTIEILNNRELFLQFINNKTVDQISFELKIDLSTVYKRIQFYNIDNSLYIKKTKSKYEDQIEDFLIKNNITYIKNTRKILKSGKELDFYIPDYNIAIELNSLYYHCEFKDNKDKWYHYNKWKDCIDMNIKLLSIFDDEWIEKSDIIKNKILILCNRGNKGIFARNTKITEINKKQATEFLSKYHLIGDVNSTIKLGTFYNNELIGVMTFVKNNDGYILNRYSSNFLLNTGIFSKMLKYFINNYNPKFIISFSDNRYSDGNLYDKNGFALEAEIDPDYYITNYKKRFHKFNFRKNNIKSKYNIDIQGKTETELVKIIGYDRIWDCGKKRWIMYL